MYTKGIKMKENKDRLIAQANVLKERIETKGCTFKPKLLTAGSKWGKNEKKRRAVSMADGVEM